jgi:hypothetical protein
MKIKGVFPMVIGRGRRKEHLQSTFCTTAKKNKRGEKGRGKNTGEKGTGKKMGKKVRKKKREKN